MTTLAHEGTHQLAFNTGLLNRQGMRPAVVEGIVLYGETGSLHGPATPGQINATRLDDLAHIQRREKWISAADLLTDDAVAFGKTLDRTLLAYAEGWLLVYYLMQTPIPSAPVSGLFEDDRKAHGQESSIRRRGEAFR